ncbi:hypothetical protein EYF80_001151 [Liparis tanakae]|uniref:Uncharacterized protein n=1 Tax=Liparis tanakae TaxID=230148 RepID=A0A4Z2JDR8_9TELE|nr:hypothetical protein EYF80_001151 [Liparis tanakae]
MTFSRRSNYSGSKADSSSACLSRFGNDRVAAWSESEEGTKQRYSWELVSGLLWKPLYRFSSPTVKVVGSEANLAAMYGLEESRCRRRLRAGPSLDLSSYEDRESKRPRTYDSTVCQVWEWREDMYNQTPQSPPLSPPHTDLQPPIPNRMHSLPVNLSGSLASPKHGVISSIRDTCGAADVMKTGDCSSVSDTDEDDNDKLVLVDK